MSPVTGEVAGGGSEESFHIRRVEDYAVEKAILVGKIPTIYARFYLGSMFRVDLCFGVEVREKKPVAARRDLFPEYALAIGDVGDQRTLRDVQVGRRREDLRVVGNIRREHHVVSGDATLYPPTLTLDRTPQIFLPHELEPEIFVHLCILSPSCSVFMSLLYHLYIADTARVRYITLRG